MSISKQGWLIKKLFRYLVTNPVKAIRMIDRRNIKILWKAIRSESPRQIFNNFLKRISHREDIQKTIEAEGIILRCTLSRVYDYKIHLQGWCLGETEIAEVKVFIKGQLIGKVDYGLESVDVKKAFPNNQFSNIARYNAIFWGAFDPNEPITLVAKDHNGREEQIILEKFTNTEQQDYNQYINLNKLTTRDILSVEKKVLELAPIGLTVVTFFNDEDIEVFNAIKESLQAQYFSNWEWLIYLSPKNATMHKKLASDNDERIQLYSDEQLNKPAAVNWLIAKRKYNHVIHLDENSVLDPTAFYELSNAIKSKKEFGIIYTDEDKLNEQSKRSKPHFKSGLNHDLLLATNYIGNFITMHNLPKGANNLFDEELENAYLYYFLLEQMKDDSISNIPKVLIHKREQKNIPSFHVEYKQAIVKYLTSNKINAIIEDGKLPNTFNVKRKIVADKKVSIIIPFKDEVELLKSCLTSIEKNTDYLNYEIILVSNNSVSPDTFQFVEQLKVKDRIQFHEYNIPFNYSKINNWAVNISNGEYVLFLNNDIEVISKGWLSSMVSHVQREEVGAVGAKLLYFDNSVQHAGVVIGIGGLADHIFKLFPDAHEGYFGRANLTQNLSACTAACLMVKKSDFELVNGFDEENLAIEFNDVDLCLKLRKQNKLIVYNPMVKLFHYESKSRGKNLTSEKVKRSEQESSFFISKWKDFITDGDHYYNENLDLRYGDFSINV